MYFLRARYLNTNTGRFHTQDSYHGRNSEPLSLHKYLYTHGNPVNGTDPTGNFLLVNITAAQAGQIALAGAVFGGAAGAIGEYAITGAVSWKGIVYGALSGALLAPAAAVAPAVGAALGLAGVAYGSVTFGQLLFDSELPISRRISAGAMIVASLWGAHAGVKYYNNAKIFVGPPSASGGGDLPPIKLFHKGELNRPNKSSLSLGPDIETISVLDRSGSVHKFEIPPRKFAEWEAKGLVERYSDTDHVTGARNAEVRLLGPAAEEAKGYIVE
jgi:hypothetical protein